MAGERKHHQAVFFAGALADVVNHQRRAGRAFFIAYEHDVRQVARQGAGNDISGRKSACV